MIDLSDSVNPKSGQWIRKNKSVIGTQIGMTKNTEWVEVMLQTLGHLIATIAKQERGIYSTGRMRLFTQLVSKENLYGLLTGTPALN